MGFDTRSLSLMATSIGSLPHQDAAEACRVTTTLLSIPAWPQLPRRGFRENMYAQYSEGFPGIVVDEAAERIYVHRGPGMEAGLERLYAAYLESDLGYGAISPGYASGLWAFPAVAAGREWPAVKGSVTGPISWGLTVTDEDKRAILYDETLADAVAKHLRLKAAWQERELLKICPRTITFVDEPYMSAFGSAFFSLERDLVVQLLTETMGGIQGLIGVHCCGNTDWSLLMETPVHILNFDAWAYAEALALYPEDVRRFLRRGGLLAWGIVPSGDEEAILHGTVDGMTARLLDGMGLLVQKGIPLDDLLAGCLVSPSCGLGGRSERAAVRALELSAGIAAELRRRYRL